MPQAAPRYDPRIFEVAREIDDESLPMAEICRRVGSVAEALGMTRPSYVHLRRFVRAERIRRRELRELLGDVLESVARHRAIDTYVIADRVRDIEGHRALRSRS